MPKFKTSFTCDVCGKKITFPNFRIEWGYNKLPESHKAELFEFLQVCHEDCSLVTVICVSSGIQLNFLDSKSIPVIINC